MRVRAAVLGAFALAIVIVIAALVVGRLPGRGSDSPGDLTTSDSSSSSRSPSPSGHGGKEQAPSRATKTPYRLPSAEPLAPLISTPLPKAASARGAIAAGFPTAVIPLAPASSVTYSSVSSDRKRLQAGLDATSKLAPDEVLGFYRTKLAPLGLVATSAPAASGWTAVAFVRGASTLTVTASAAGAHGSRYSIHGVLVAGS